MSAAMEKTWCKKAMGRYYDPDTLNGDCYFKVVKVEVDDPENENYIWVILHAYCIQDNEIVALWPENDTSNEEFTYSQMPSTLTIMTEDEAIDKLNSVIEASKPSQVTDDEVAEIYSIVKSGKGFIALSPSNKRYLVVDGRTHTSNDHEVHVVKYELLRGLVPRTYKNSSLLDDASGYIYTIDNKCKKDKQGNIILRKSKLRFNMDNLEIVPQQEVANILNRIYDAVEYWTLGNYRHYYDTPYWKDRPWNNN